MNRLDSVGAAYNIKFAWSGKTGNSRDSHRLILLAASQDQVQDQDQATSPSPAAPRLQLQPNNNNIPGARTKQEELIEYILSQTFQHGADPSSRAFLARAAVTVGVFRTEEAALAYLDQEEEEDDNEHGQEVDRSSEAARRLGVTAVPSYVVQGRWQVGGMQREEMWLRLFERVRVNLEGKGGKDMGMGMGMGIDGVRDGEGGKGSLKHD